MFRIQRSADGKFVVFALSRRIKAARVNELQKLLESEADDLAVTAFRNTTNDRRGHCV
jgi:hypothetical protein